MIINGKPIDYLYVHCLQHQAWLRSRDIKRMLPEFEVGSTTFEDFLDEIDIAAEFGEEFAESIEHKGFMASDELASLALSQYSSEPATIETLHEVYDNENEDAHEHIKALIALCHEALVNSLFVKHKKLKSADSQ